MTPVLQKSDTSPLVLRTVNLSQRDDDRLKRYGLAVKRSKNDLIREAVGLQLDVWEREQALAEERARAAAQETARATAGIAR